MSKINTFVPNSFQTPNGYVEDVMAYLTGEEYKVLSYATRRILGFQKRQDRISLSQFTDGTKNGDGDVLDYGTGLSVDTVKNCLSNLASFGLMVKVQNNDPKTNEGTLWALQLDTDKVNRIELEQRRQQKEESNKNKIKKARSVRQAHLVPQPPHCETEGTPHCTTEAPPPLYDRNTISREIQGNPEPLLSDEEKEQANNKLTDFLASSRFPGFKRQARIDAILSYFGGKLRINTENRQWKEFAKWVDDRQQTHGENMETFVKWMLGRKDFDVTYWSVRRMQEMWPQAFIPAGHKTDDTRGSYRSSIPNLERDL